MQYYYIYNNNLVQTKQLLTFYQTFIYNLTLLIDVLDKLN